METRPMSIQMSIQRLTNCLRGKGRTKNKKCSKNKDLLETGLKRLVNTDVYTRLKKKALYRWRENEM
jgi:hypothetical protein